MGSRLSSVVPYAVLAAACVAMGLMQGPKRLSDDTKRAARAEVVEVDDSALQTHGLVEFGTEHLKVRLSDGKTYKAENELRAQMELDKKFRVGDVALVILPDELTDDAILIARDHWRLGWGLAFFAAFSVLLCAFGGWTGAKALFSFLFSCFAVWKLLVPLSLAGLARWMRRLRTFAAEAILRPLFSVRSARKMLADPRERFYTNSEYVANVMRAFYGTFNNRLFYPPTIFEPTPGDEGRQPNKVVYLGRLTPLKGIRELILVVEKARRISGADLVFELAGCLPASAYAEEIKEMFRSRPWVRHVGEKYGSDKRAFLASGTYALHACREEAFGISVTEYLKAGVLPIVPDEGGSPEIAAAEELVFRDYDTAAAKLAALVQDPALHERLVSHCRSRAGMFAREAYLARQHELFEGILAGS